MAEFRRHRRYRHKETTKRKKYDEQEVSLFKMGKRQLMLVLISVFAVVIAAVGTSFAIFTTSVKSSDYNVIKVGTLNVDFGSDANNTLSLANQYPISDSVGQASNPYTFTITNTGTLAADYIVKLVNDDDMITQDGCGSNQVNKSYVKYSLDGNSPGLLSAMESSSYTIATGSLEAGESKTYQLRIWLSELAGNDAVGKHFHGKIVVEAVNAQGELVADVLLAGVGENGSINTSDTEQTFITGTNPNNYIWYSGKLWRAVSIDTSDNSVKLVTEWNVSATNYNPSNNTAFDGSHMEAWLNDTSVDGFLGNLRDPDNFIKMNSLWNATQTTATTKPAKTTMVEAAVGLLNVYEYTMSYSGTTSRNGYLNNGLNWWTLTPNSSTNLRVVDSYGGINPYGPLTTYGIRPAIHLKSNVRIVSGDGTKENPYRLGGDNDSNLSGTSLSTRYSGEYITFGTGENNLYRIVSHEVDGLTKITSADPLKDSGTFKTSALGSVNYSANTTLGQFLNEEYLTDYVGSSYRSMIEANGVWYLGTVGSGSSYRLAKYTTATGNTHTSNTTTAQVGLLRIGELMAGQFERSVSGTTSTGLTTSYWLLTKGSSSLVYRIVSDTIGSSVSPTTTSGIRPALYLKADVIIKGGTGTKEDPFQLSYSGMDTTVKDSAGNTVKYTDGSTMEIGDRFRIYYANNTNYVIDVANGAYINGTNIQLYTNSSTNQSWFGINESASNGYYNLYFYPHPTMFIDINGGVSTAGANIQLYIGNNSNAQKWSFVKTGSGYNIKSLLGTCIDLYGGTVANSQNIQAYTCSTTNNAQIWSFGKE